MKVREALQQFSNMSPFDCFDDEFYWLTGALTHPTICTFEKHEFLSPSPENHKVVSRTLEGLGNGEFVTRKPYEMFGLVLATELERFREDLEAWRDEVWEIKKQERQESNLQEGEDQDPPFWHSGRSHAAYQWLSDKLNKIRNHCRRLIASMESQFEPETPQDEEVSRAELPKKIGVSRVTIHRWTKLPDFPPPCRMLGRKTWYKLSQVAEWLRVNKAGDDKVIRFLSTYKSSGQKAKNSSHTTHHLHPPFK